MGLEPTSLTTGSFRNCFLTNSGDLHCQACLAKAPGTGIEPAAFWFRARRIYQQLLPRIRCMTDMRAAFVRRARGRGFEPLSPDSKSGSLPLADPRIRSVKSAMRESNPPVQLGRLGHRPARRRLVGLPIGQWHMSGYKRKGDQSGLPADRCPSRTRKSVSVLGRFRGGCHHPLACPSVLISTGSRNRTCVEFPHRWLTATP